MSKSKEPGIYSRKLANGKTVYDAVAKVHGKQRWSRGHRTLAEAKAARDEMRVSMRRGQMGTAPARLTLGEYLTTRWWPEVEGSLRSAESRRSYEAQLRHIIGFCRCERRRDARHAYAERGSCPTWAQRFGERKLTSLGPLDMIEFKELLRAEGVGLTMQNMAFDRLRHALKLAVYWELIWRNPGDLVAAPPVPEHEPPDLSVDDVLLMLRTADETTDYGMMIYFDVLTGLRWGELKALLWSDIDFATGSTRVLRENTKSRAGKRRLKLGPALLARLQQYRLEQMKRFEEAKQPPPALVFTSKRGRPLNQGNFHEDVWTPLRERLGLPEMHFHDLRHVNSTLMARAGVHPALMSERLGHTDSKLALEVYTDLQYEDQAPAAAALEGLLGVAAG